MNLTNDKNIPLLLAPWLVSDNYDYIHDPKYISATSLMKPIQEIILSSRIDHSDETHDLSEYIARQLGNSVHDSVEHTWTNPRMLHKSLKLLGMTQDQIDLLEVNPDVIDPEKTNVFLEKRSFKQILGYKIGGKFDAVIDGLVHDIKTTSAYSWLSDDKDEDYRIQGSLYRWLNPDIITEDYIRVCFLFTDWQQARADASSDYPDCRAKYKDIQLMTIEETENWVRERIRLIDHHKNHDPVDLPQCSDREVWLTEAVHKYFSNPDKTDGRSTKNFTDYKEAMAHRTKQGKGVVVSTLPIAKKCSKYCKGFDLCVQKDSFNLE